jgi:hypothetical protein
MLRTISSISARVFIRQPSTVGQNIIPRRYDPLVDSLDPQRIQSKLEELRTGIRGCVESMPSHWDFVVQGGRVGAAAPRQG